jgi:hypothetical protein
MGSPDLANGLNLSAVATGKPSGGVSFPFSFTLLPSFFPRLLYHGCQMNADLAGVTINGFSSNPQNRS